MKCEETFRAFVAIEISDEARKGIAGFQTRLARVASGTRWVPPRNVHLTLAFLGDISAETGEGLCRALDEVASSSSPFSFEVAGTGVFGKRGAPRIVWAGVRGDVSRLRALHARLTARLADLGLRSDDRPFAPHLTVARIRDPRRATELVRKLANWRDASFGHVTVRRVVLMRSVLGPTGAVYSLVHQAPLGEASGEGTAPPPATEERD